MRQAGEIHSRFVTAFDSGDIDSLMALYEVLIIRWNRRY
jgi:hypothetical protein